MHCLCTLLTALSLHAAPLTVDEALAEARAHNANLPAARADARGAEARARELRAQLYPTIELDGDVQVARPGAYADSHALAKVLASMTLFDMGRRRAELRSALADLQVATLAVRKAEADLFFEVRTRFDELSALNDEIEARRDALKHLEKYLTLLDERRAGGQGSGSDALKTRALLLANTADLEALRRERSTAALELNTVLGREPGAELVLAPVQDVPWTPSTRDRPWEQTSDVASAMASATSAQEALAGAQAERGPRLDARAELGGVKPMLGSTLDATNVPTAPGSGFGGAVGLTLTLPLFDFGAISARISQARAKVDKSKAEVSRALREAQLQWSLASHDYQSLSRELALRTQAAPVAKDAYLTTEALYRGGVGSALEVLDAYNNWVDAEVRVLETRQAVRDARARLLRWEGR